MQLLGIRELFLGIVVKELVSMKIENVDFKP